jgi:membrane protein YqaA with SNARE-associated domain
MRRALWILSVSALIPLIPFLVIGELPGERWLVATRDNAVWFGATGAALLALDMLLPIPSSVIGALLGGRLGLAAGFGCAFVGLCVGHLVGYALGRLAPLRFAAELPSAPSRALVFLSRPVPVLAEAVAITAGAERMPLWAFVASMGLGNAVYAAAMAANGAALLPQGLAGPGLIVPMIVPVAGWLIARHLRRRAAP